MPRHLHSRCWVQWVEQELFQTLMPNDQSRTPGLPFQRGIELMDEAGPQEAGLLKSCLSSGRG